MSPLFSAMPNAATVLALEPEELAGVLLDLVPLVMNGPRFVIGSFTQPTPPYENDYPQAARTEIEFAIAEATSWMQAQGIIMRDPGQPADWYVLTRRGKQIGSRANLEAYKAARTLPTDLLQPYLEKKVALPFARGDYDAAVFQAFKEVEIAVRQVAHLGPELIGTNLMSRAFNPENGPLADQALVPAERQAEMALFTGAMGHAKNPTSHREVNLSRQEAARLIVFASHLLDIVTKRLL
jgi:uncharacterized protein (TIGR02391 family)